MIKKFKHIPTLHGQANYQIKVPGGPDLIWLDWVEEMTVVVERDDDGLPITILTGMLDQAALLGLLRHLYSLGLPLISVVCVTADTSDE